MPQSSGTDAIVGFGEFTVDAAQATLCRSGVPVALQDKPLQLLLALLERPGQIVAREELCSRLWPDEDFGAFDIGLNTAIRKLRIALGDSTETPQFIETVPRRGYRFIAPVETVTSSAGEIAPTGSPVPVLEPGAEGNDSPAAGSNSSWAGARRWVWITGAAVLAAAVAVGVVWWRQAHAAPVIHSVAVLPFTNLSGDASQDYFADAMTEELTGDLGNFAALRVISRTSAMLYKKTQKTAPEIARELNVDGVIEGSVVRSGDRVRITAQLIYAPSDRHLWAESYERDLKDVLTLQSEIARTIAGKVEAVVTPAEVERMRPQEVKPEAYEAYLLGRGQLEKWTTSSSTEAARYFEHAIELDNRFALAYIGLAESYISHPGVAGVSSSEAQKRAIDAATKAIELKPDMGEAHVILGGLLMLEWDFAGAEAEMRKGVALSPGYGAGHHWYSHLLMYRGRYDEAMVESQKMLELDPLSPAANLHMGYMYEAKRDWDHAIEQLHKTLRLDPNRDWDHAIEQLHKTLRLDPNYVSAHEELGRVYMGKGMYPEGIAELRRAAELVHADSDRDYAWHAGELGYALARSGNTAEAKKILAAIPQNDPAAASSVYAGLGDSKRSIELLTEAYRLHEFPLDAGFLVQYDSLRSDPRFDQLLHDVGLR